MPPRPRHRLPITDPGELSAALDRLDERERLLLEMRYGLSGTRLHNLREIGKLLGLSGERARQLEARAIAKLAPDHPTAGSMATKTRTAAGRSPPASHREVVRRWALILLWLQPGHVYELRQRLLDLGLPPPTYRHLYELENDGLLSSTWAPASKDGPKRRVYKLTRQGLDQLKADRGILEKTAQTLTAFLAQHDKPADPSAFNPAAAKS